ncbi:MAG: tetratricopeptide repeat protein [Burkholderiales bacterium]
MKPSRLSAALAVALSLFVALSAARADDYQEAAQLFKQGRLSAAMTKVDAVLVGNPKDARSRFLKGLILTEQDKPQEAIRVFTALTADYPELPEPYNNLAVLHAAQGHYAEAQRALEMAIRTHPSYAIAHENLGDVYAKMASEAYDKALQLDRSSTTAQTKLSLIRELFSSTPEPAPVAAPAAAPVAAPAAKPAAPEPAPVAERPADRSADVLAAVDNWARAWSRQDVNAYLASYAPDFQTPRGENREAWANLRRERVSAPEWIEVTVASPDVSFESDDRATVVFRQTYKSNILTSTDVKTLIMSRVNNRWLIRRETIGR